MRVIVGKEITKRPGLFLTNNPNSFYTQDGLYLINKREAIQEDETGTLRAAVDDQLYRSRKRHLLEQQANIRLSMVEEKLCISIEQLRIVLTNSSG
jgi:hypothetical protein